MSLSIFDCPIHGTGIYPCGFGQQQEAMSTEEGQMAAAAELRELAVNLGNPRPLIVLKDVTSDALERGAKALDALAGIRLEARRAEWDRVKAHVCIEPCTSKTRKDGDCWRDCDCACHYLPERP